MRNLITKTAALALAACFIATLVAAPGADAGLLDKLTKKKDRDRGDTPRYDNYPTMTFHVGQLARGALNSWQLDDYTLQLTGDCTVQASGGQEGTLQEGSPAIVTGALVDGTLIAYRVTILDPNYDQGPGNPDIQIEWSESDPTVGVGTGSAPH